MGFRPGHIRSAWCGLDSGGGAGSFITWQHSFYANTVRTDATLIDRVYTNLIRGNLAQSAAVPKYYVCQGFFHPDYDSGKVTARLSFTSLNTVSVSTITFNGAFRSWDDGDNVNLAISPGMVQTINVAVNAAELTYSVDIELQDYGNHIPGNMFEARVNMTAKGSAAEINITTLALQYNLTRKYV